MSRPIRFISYATPTAHGRVYCLSISNQFRCHAYHIISKWKDIVINKNHLFTSHWSLFSLLIPFEKTTLQLVSLLLPGILQDCRLPLHGHWTLSPWRSFFHTNLLWTSSHLVEKSVSRDSNPKHICVLSVDLLLLLCPLSYIPITALWRLALVFIVPCMTLSSSNLQRLTRIPVDCF